MSDSDITLSPCQSLALRRMIDAMRADDAIYEACPPAIRSALADLLLPPHSSAEKQILDLEAAHEKALQLAEKFGARIRELEQRKGSVQ